MLWSGTGGLAKNRLVPALKAAYNLLWLQFACVISQHPFSEMLLYKVSLMIPAWPRSHPPGLPAPGDRPRGGRKARPSGPGALFVGWF